MTFIFNIHFSSSGTIRDESICSADVLHSKDNKQWYDRLASEDDKTKTSDDGNLATNDSDDGNLINSEGMEFSEQQVTNANEQQ